MTRSKRLTNWLTFKIISPGQFWPGLEMGRIGLSDVFFLPKNYEWEGSFVMTQKTLIDKEDIRCQKVKLEWDKNSENILFDLGSKLQLPGSLDGKKYF